MLSDYENFFNSLDLLLFVLDLDGNIIYCNETVVDRLGYTRDELIGMPIVNIHPPDQRLFATMIIQDMMEGIASVCPIPVLTKDNSLIQVETRVINGQWDGGPALFGVTKDVTDLRLSNEKFRTIFRFCPIPIAITGVSNGKIYDVNDAWTELTGYTQEDIKDKTIYDLELYRDDKEREDLVSQLKRDGVLHNYPIIMKVKNGKIVIGQFSAASIIINNIDCWITAMVDRTGQSNLEKAITKFHETVVREARDGIVQSLKDGTFIR